MFRFLRRLGCLVVFGVLAIVAWMTRDLWSERLLGRRAASREVEWQPAAPAREASAKARLADLAKESGPVYANFSGGEVAALILGEVARRYPGTLSDVQGAVVANELQLNALVDLSDARGLERLGPVASLLSSRRRVTLAGVPRVLTPGTGEFRVASVRIDDVYLPRPALSIFLDQLLRQSGSPASDVPAVTFPLPRHVGDIRVSNGAMTLYKRVP
jgi:hypothetical protein